MAFVPKYVLILFFIITVDFFLAFYIQKYSGRKRFLFLLVSIIINLSTLFFFKYFNFFNENIALLAEALNFNYAPILLEFVLPLGLSFHIFQSLSYTIEVYKGNYLPEKNFITYALYVMFFPQLVAGPIERPQHLLPQFHTPQAYDSLRVRRGLERILWGFFKKLVIADQIANIINPLFAKLEPNGILLIIMAILFTYQIYCDFSGYSDIAVGSAMLLGFTLVENFNRPFAAKSVSEFWQRWHISLSQWLKDYLYYPLIFGMGKISKLKLYIASILTFTLIGLWHGANWTYVIFGFLHGLYLVIGEMTSLYQKKLKRITESFLPEKIYNLLQTCVVFILVCISFIIFRSETMEQAVWFITHMFTSISLENFWTLWFDALDSIIGAVGKSMWYVILISIVLLEGMQYIQEKQKTFFILENRPYWNFTWTYFLLVFIIVFGQFSSQSFIYFQF